MGFKDIAASFCRHCRVWYDAQYGKITDCPEFTGIPYKLYGSDKIYKPELTKTGYERCGHVHKPLPEESREDFEKRSFFQTDHFDDYRRIKQKHLDAGLPFDEETLTTTSFKKAVLGK